MSNIKEKDLSKKLLADTFAIYLKTLNYHWNIRNSKEFYPIHILLEKQYTDLAEAADEIAEHIASGGDYAPGTFKELAALTSIKDGSQTYTDMEMLEDLVKDHHSIVEMARENEDKVSFLLSDLLINRAKDHNKMAWMLESSIKHRK